MLDVSQFALLGRRLTTHLSGRAGGLPARFPDAGNQSRPSHFAKCNAAYSESAQITARPSRQCAAVTHADGTRVAREPLQAFPITRLLQPPTPLGILGHRAGALTLSSDPAFLCHRFSVFLVLFRQAVASSSLLTKGIPKALSSAKASSSVSAVVTNVTSSPEI